MKTPTILTPCALIPPSSSLAGGCPTRALQPVFAADAVAAGERAFAEGRDPADMGARRSMDGLLRSGACVRHSRYRRHLRRARASAARSSTPTTTSVASCRFMSTTPSARVPSRWCCAPARPRRGSRCALICAGSCARHPPTLDQDAHHLPGRQPLRLSRGDGMVRGQPHRLRLRAARFEAAGKENRRGGGRGARTERVCRTSLSCAATPKRATRPNWSR